MSDDIRIEALTQELFESGIETSERDALADDLEYARTINGSPDAALQGIKRIAISNVRREMLAHKRMKKHESDCPFRRAGADPSLAGTGTTLKILTVMKALSPFKWPIAVACFSPYAGGILKSVADFFK